MKRDPKDVIGVPANPPQLPDPPFEREITVQEMGDHLSALRLPGGIPCEMSLASCTAILQRTGPPERLERLVSDLRDRGGLKLLGDGAETLHWLAGTARSALDYLEAGGLRFDFDRNVATIPDGRRGPDTKLVTEAVGAAFEQVGRSREEWYGAATLAAIRERLEGLVAPEDLSDAKIKRRLQRYIKRRRSAAE